jgi:hypothetical protein
MNEDSSLTCVCGRSFAQPGGLAYHHRSCKKNKVRFAGALRTAKDAWTSRKRRRFGAVQSEHKNLPQQDANLESAMEVHDTNAMDVEVQIFPWIHFKTDSMSQAVIQPQNHEDETNGLTPQPGPVIDAIEVICCCVALGLIILNKIFRKLPCPLRSVDHVG